MNKTASADHNECVHCGAECGKAPVTDGEARFCCEGCKTVYGILHDKKLFTYYELEKRPGIRVESQDKDPKYEFLDNDEIAQKLLTFSEGSLSKVKLYIPVIHCASCIWLLEHLYKLHPGIRFSSVNFARKETDITFDRQQISLRGVVELLVSIHYIPDLSESMVLHERKPASYKSLLYKMGLAGFAFLNVMTYSLPGYFNGKPVDGRLGTLLAVLSLILTIPVVFYSGSDYILSGWKNLKNRSVNIDLPIAIGIITLFTVTAFEVMTGTGQGYSDSLSGFIFFLLVGRWYQGKTYEALSFERNYKSFFPIAVTKINRQVEESILLEKVQPGDLLLIRNKELIPADSRLAEGTGMVDYSFVTGESTIAVKKEGDFLYAGGRQMGGIIRIRVEKDVDQSHLTHLWNVDETNAKPTDKLQNLTDRVSRHFTVIVIAIALAGFAGWMISGDTHKAFFVFTAVLIVACPCALALSVPFTFGNSMRILGKNGMYIKNTRVIEKMTEIDTIVFDKTGTLTNPAENKIEYIGRELSEEEKTAISSLARQSAHPLSIALAAQLKDEEYRHPAHFVEVEGQGVFGEVEGLKIRMGSKQYVTGEEQQAETGGSAVFVAINNEPAGYFSVFTPYRDGLDSILQKLQNSYDLYLLTGDNEAEKENLKRHFREDAMFFNQKPQEKARFIESLQKKGKVIMMTGDGLNDAGALMQSDVALTVANRAYQFSPACDAVLESGRFGLLDRFICFAGRSKKIVYLSFLISSCYNVAGITIALAGHMSPVVAAILMPLSSVSVVLFATFATRLAGRTTLHIKA